MADFVSRSKVEFELCGGNLPEKYKAFVRRVLNDKNLIPTADVAPVVRGRFVHIGPRFAGGIDWWNCSICDSPVSGAETRFVYCPHCGAKMDGGDSDGR